MLLIDGVKYEKWTPPSEDEFEQVVKEHAQDIFGEQSIYLDRKQKLKSLAGVGSIPDGYVITLGDSPQWHIVEVELSSHPLHEHIVSQVSKFIAGINNPSTRDDVKEAIYYEITKDGFLKLRLTEAIGPIDSHKFLSDLISKPPILTIIIEKASEELENVKKTLAFLQIKVVEFQTLTREGAEGLVVHAHLFEPLFPPTRILTGNLVNRGMIISEEDRQKPKSERARGLKLYVKDGKHYNPKEALLALGATLIKMEERRSGLRATMPDGIILEYVGSTKNGKSKIAKVHTYLLGHGFTFSQRK